MLFRTLFPFFLFGIFSSAWAQINSPFICPAPRTVIDLDGTFKFAKTITVQVTDSNCESAAKLLQRELVIYVPQKVDIQSVPGQIKLVIDSHKGFAAQAYDLKVGTKDIIITAADQQGLYSGVISLLWLVRDAAAKTEANYPIAIKAVQIVDYPDIKMRGMDMQWCYEPVDEQFILDTARTLGMLKYNVIVPEFGPNFLPDKYKQLGSKKQLANEQLKQFVQYCNSWGLEVIPKINSLGHVDRGVPWPHRLGNGLDIGNNENYEVLFAIVDAYITACPSLKYFHFGMDEAESCLVENSKKYNKPAAVLYTEHLKRVEDFCKSRHITPIVYHDMLLGSQEEIYWREGVANATKTESFGARKNMSRDFVINYWNYEAFERYRTVENFQKEGFKIWFTPWAGASVFTMPRNAQVLNAAVVGSTWFDGTYRDSFSENGSRFWKYCTQRWLYDAYANLSTANWNTSAPVNNGFDPGFDAGLVMCSLYWDKIDYIPEPSIPVRLTKIPQSALSTVRPILDALKLREGKQQIKGITFNINQSNMVVLGNIETQSDLMLKQPKPWQLYVDGAKYREISGINEARKADSLVLYTRAHGKTTLTNQYGRELNVRCGLTHYVDDWGVGNMAVPRNGYVISGNGEGIYSASVFTDYHSVKIVDANGNEVKLGCRDPKGEYRKTIQIDKQAKSLAFLHTTAFEAAYFMPAIATIEIKYDDDSNDTFKIVYGRDICSYDDVCFLYAKNIPNRKWMACQSAGKGLNDGTLIYAYEWINQKPKQKIRNVTIELGDTGRKIGYLLLGMSVIN